MSQVYFSPVNVRKSCKYINFAVRSERGLREQTSAVVCMRAKQMERNNSESNMHFSKIFVVGHLKVPFVESKTYI